MTELAVGVIDVFVVDPNLGFRVLVLRRGEGTRCTGAWEVVHGRVEGSERPEDAAVREVGEETGLAVARLYNVICQPFYLHRLSTVHVGRGVRGVRRLIHAGAPLCRARPVRMAFGRRGPEAAHLAPLATRARGRPRHARHAGTPVPPRTCFGCARGSVKAGKSLTPPRRRCGRSASAGDTVESRSHALTLSRSHALTLSRSHALTLSRIPRSHASPRSPRSHARHDPTLATLPRSPRSHAPRSHARPTDSSRAT